MSVWDAIEPYLELITPATALLGPLLTAATIVWILTTKRNSTSAVAWCLLVFFLPIIGPLFFLLFGWQHVNRPLRRKRRQKRLFARSHGTLSRESLHHGIREESRQRVEQGELSPQEGKELETRREDLSQQEETLDSETVVPPNFRALERLARRCGSFPATTGNSITIYNEGQPAYDDMLAAIRSAKHHIHLETFIFQPDGIGRIFLEALTEKARQGMQVRLLYDAMGTHRLRRGMLAAFRHAGGKCSQFLPINPFRRRIQVNMRNHRKF